MKNPQYTCQIQTAAELLPLYQESAVAFCQQSPAWAEVIQKCSSEQTHFITVNEESNPVAGLMVFEFSGPRGSVLNSVPFPGAHSGVIFHESLSSEKKQQVFDQLLKFICHNFADSLSFTLITNPLDSCETQVTPDFVLRNFCQVMPLSQYDVSTPNVSVGRSKYNADIRSNLKVALNNGLSVEFCSDQEDFESWYQIHCLRHAELNATPLPKNYLKAIVDTESNDFSAKLLLVKQGSTMIGGVILIWNHNIADVFIMSSTRMDLRPNYLLTYELLRFFKSETSVRQVNWQSCQPDSGVFQFKKKWGSKVFHYDICTWKLSRFDQLFDSDLDQLRSEYQWHYLAPFVALKEKLSTGRFDKAQIQI